MARVIRPGTGRAGVAGDDSRAAVGPDLLDGPSASLAGAVLRWKRETIWPHPRAAAHPEVGPPSGRPPARPRR